MADYFRQKAMFGASMEQDREFSELIEWVDDGTRDGAMHKVVLERDSNPALQADFERRVARLQGAMEAGARGARDTQTGSEALSPYRPDAPLWTDLHLAVARRLTVDEVRGLAEAGELPGYRLPGDEAAAPYYFLKDDVASYVRGTGPARRRPVQDELHHVHVIDLPGCQRHPEPCLYVGQSWYCPEERFLRHLVGIHHSQDVWSWGTALRRDLYAALSPRQSRTLSQAQAAELREELIEDGYAMHGAGAGS